MMRKSMKMVVKVLAISMAVGCLMTGVVPGKSGTVSAAKIKLNKKTLSLKVGEKKLLYVKGSKKKVKWSSDNKKVAKVSSSGIVTAKKAGTCKIKAKVGKKKLTCKVKVTVKGKSNSKPVVSAAPVGTTLSNSELAAKITVSMQPVYKSGTVLFTISNGNDSLIDTYKVSYQFAGASGVVDSGTFSGFALSPGAVQYNAVYVGKDKTKLIDANLSTVSTTVENYTYTHTVDATGEVAVTLGEGSDASKVPVTIVNSGTGKNYVRGVAIFTDISGNIVLAQSVYTSVDAGATKFEEVQIPYDVDENGKYIEDATRQWVRVPYAAKKVLYNAYR